MRRGSALLLALLLLLWVPMLWSLPGAAGPTFVSGVLPGDTTWTVSGSPYIVTGDVTVPANVTLRIEPGVRVRFDAAGSARSILVSGRILSTGVPGNPVTFTSDDPIPDRNDWGSIQLLGSDLSRIEYSEFSWGSTTIDIRQCSPVVANNTILESGLRAVSVIGPNAAPLIENNHIQTQLFNQRAGIITQQADPIIRNNTFSDNFFGIFVSLGGRPRIENNTIRNGWRGIVVVSSDPYIANNTIVGNGLPNFGGEGILLFDAAATLRDNVIRNNGVGVDIPYNSKRTLALSSGNVVNGMPLHTLYRLGDRGTVIRGLDLDSGRSAGFTGNATEQGLLTLYDSENVTVDAATLRNNRALLFTANSTATVVNSSFANSSNMFLLTSISHVVSLNNDFRMDAVNFTDQRSALTVKNFLHVRTLTETSFPLSGVQVSVSQDGAEIARAMTDVDGWSRWSVAPYGVLARLGPAGGPPSFTRPVIEVEVAHPTYMFRGTPRLVNMSTTHTETFVQSDQVPPRVVDTIPAMDSIGVQFGSRITIVFSEAMNRTSTEAAIGVIGYSVGDFAWSTDGRSVSFRILDAQFGTTYYVQVRDSATDIAGNRLANTYRFSFDVEHAPRRVDLGPVWIASLVILAAGLLAVAWRSRTRAKALGEEEGNREKEREA